MERDVTTVVFFYFFQSCEHHERTPTTMGVLSQSLWRSGGRNLRDRYLKTLENKSNNLDLTSGFSFQLHNVSGIVALVWFWDHLYFLSVFLTRLSEFTPCLQHRQKRQTLFYSNLGVFTPYSKMVIPIASPVITPEEYN